MAKNVMQFKKSEYIKRTTEEIVDNCVETLVNIKHIDHAKIKVPKLHKKDSLSSEVENPDMNLK